MTISAQKTSPLSISYDIIDIDFMQKGESKELLSLVGCHNKFCFKALIFNSH